MDREIILATLAIGICGPVLLVLGRIPLKMRAGGTAKRSEQIAWRRLWLPLLPPGILLGFLVGWALQEPDVCEVAIGPVVFLAVAPFAAIWLRAGFRATRALLSRDRVPSAATLGILRPHAIVSEELRARLDDQALDAVLEHEAAHARHFDPLRLWVAQIATDLQWPSSAARRRFKDWRIVLELARDEEACDRGVDGPDLAAALIEAARLGTGGPNVLRPVVGLIDDDSGAFRERVERLLDRQAVPAASPPRRWSGWAFLTAAITVAIAIGAVCGEHIITGL